MEGHKVVPESNRFPEDLVRKTSLSQRPSPKTSAASKACRVLSYGLLFRHKNKSHPMFPTGDLYYVEEAMDERQTLKKWRGVASPRAEQDPFLSA